MLGFNWWYNLKQLEGRSTQLRICSVILTLIPVILSLQLSRKVGQFGKCHIFSFPALKVQLIKWWYDLKQLGGRSRTLGMCSAILRLIQVILSLLLSRKVSQFGQKCHISSFPALKVQLIKWWYNLKQLGGRIRQLRICSVILTLISVILSL